MLVDHHARLRIDAHPETEGNVAVQGLASRLPSNQTSAISSFTHRIEVYMSAALAHSAFAELRYIATKMWSPASGRKRCEPTEGGYSRLWPDWLQHR